MDKEWSEKLQKLFDKRKNRIDWSLWKKLSIEALRLGLLFEIQKLKIQIFYCFFKQQVKMNVFKHVLAQHEDGTIVTASQKI